MNKGHAANVQCSPQVERGWTSSFLANLLALSSRRFARGILSSVRRCKPTVQYIPGMVASFTPLSPNFPTWQGALLTPPHSAPVCRDRGLLWIGRDARPPAVPLSWEWRRIHSISVSEVQYFCATWHIQGEMQESDVILGARGKKLRWPDRCVYLFSPRSAGLPMEWHRGSQIASKLEQMQVPY
jgi:hypothetical protein